MITKEEIEIYKTLDDEDHSWLEWCLYANQNNLPTVAVLDYERYKRFISCGYLRWNSDSRNIVITDKGIKAIKTLTALKAMLG